LDIANGQVLTQNKGRHRNQEFLGFLRHIDENVTADLDLQIVLDNYSTTKKPPHLLILDFDATDDPLHGKQEGSARTCCACESQGDKTSGGARIRPYRGSGWDGP
jgi:hypothetical protein